MFRVVGADDAMSEPIDMATLRDWAAQGRVRTQTIVLDDATGSRCTAGSLPGLEAAFGARSPGAGVTPAVKLVACPACGRDLSPEAASCPNCGHPMKRPPGTPDAWGEVQRAGGYVALGVGVLMLGVQAAFLKLVGGGEARGAETLSQVFLQATPLTIAVMMIVLAGMQTWFKDFGSFWMFVVVTSMLSLVLGCWWGGLGKLPNLEGGSWLLPFRALAFYWSRYGPSLFLSAVTLGTYLAWATNRLWPERKSAGTGGA